MREREREGAYRMDVRSDNKESREGSLFSVFRSRDLVRDQPVRESRLGRDVINDRDSINRNDSSQRTRRAQ